MSIKIEFPADRTDIAEILGNALLSIANAQPAAAPVIAEDHTRTATEETASTAAKDTTQTTTTTATAVAPQDDRVDTKGVPFNPDYCGKAAKPFYASGKYEGQWKKRQGVPQEDYDAWYNMAIAQVGQTGGEPAGEQPIDPAAAFGNQNNTAAPAAAQPAAPTDTGEFMHWLSVKQTNGDLTQEQIGAAYVAEKISVADLFPPNTDDHVKACVARLYNNLSQTAGA